MEQKRWFYSYPEGVEATINLDIPDISLIDFLEDSIKNKPFHPALVFEGITYNYKELGENVRKIASCLDEKGVKKGTRVSLMMNNSPDLIFSYYAVLFLGGIIVQNNPMYKERELNYQLKDSGSEFLIIEKKILETLSLEEISVKNLIVARASNSEKFDTISNLIEKGTNEFSSANINPREDIAVLQYTGGTTGVSKGVKLTHLNLVSNVIQTDKFMGVYCKVGNERILNVLPLFHVYGMTVSMNLCFYLQSTLYLVERFDAENILSLIHQEEITMFPGTPTIYVAVNADESIEKYNLSSIHTCISGSAPLSKEIKYKFETLTGAKLVDAYGLSEASPVTHSNPVNGEQKPNSMGLPVPGTDCKIVDAEEGWDEMEINEPGELIVKGPQVMMGYWNMDEETQNALRNGWLYTGDIAYMDEAGYCFIVSRKKDVILASGYSVFPREVEETIYEHPAVEEVIVCGIPDNYRGEAVKAYIIKSEKKEDFTEKDIKDFCEKRLAKYKTPNYVEFRTQLPKSTVGKILRRKLIEEELNN